MNREEFHRAYEQMPENFKAELIGGIVYVSSPLSILHGESHMLLSAAILLYTAGTRGTSSGDKVTVLLANDAEPQPDLFLRILPEFGGQSKTTADNYVDGSPELVAEIAYSSKSIDLHGKRHDYARYGVQEYLVVLPQEQAIKWFDLRSNQEITADADGILRIRSFPGLWINAAALLVRNATSLIATLQQGLATPEHAAFVRELAAKAQAGTK
jgi:Uma2 family endonuclease